MRIVFVLPHWHDVPVGGYGVTYEYANRLSRRGHQVTVVYPRARGRLRPMGLAARPAWPLYERLRGRPRVTWMHLDNDVVLRRLSVLTRGDVAGADAVIATSWITAEDVARLQLGPSRAFYLIQGYETWSGSRQRVEATWRLPLTRIVISKWLADKAAELGALPVHHVPNAVDTTVFRIQQPIERRASTRVGMLWHQDDVKGSDVGLAAISAVRDECPDLEAELFSIYQRPAALPSWVAFQHRPSRAELASMMNSWSIFLSPSRLEGWALPPAEAMACGAALAATDIGGVRDYAVDDVTGLLVPINDPEALAQAVLRLMRDPELRMRLATQGARLLHQSFSWEQSTDRLEKVLVAAVPPPPF